MNNKEDNEKKKRIDLIIKIILIIIIIILLLHNCCLIGKEKKNNGKTPTGNVDIIEITCDKDDVCKVTEDRTIDDGKKNNNDNKTNDTKPVSGEDTEPYNDDDGGKLIVYDKDITWHGDATARIFTNPRYDLGDRIAPESSNTYQFVVKNGTKYNLKYNIDFIENNPYHINMKFKLKKNDTYIVDHYVSANELKVTNALLNTETNDTYYLEWKWISSDNDTEIGLDPNSNYELTIDIKAESTDD